MILIRTLSQYVALGISLAILLLSAVGMYLRPDKRWSLILWAVYGCIDVAFYLIVLVFHRHDIGSDFSPVRVLMQDMLVATALFFANWHDIKNWFHRWK